MLKNDPNAKSLLQTTQMPTLIVGPDKHGGIGVFAGQYIPAGSLVTLYAGQLVYPKHQSLRCSAYALRVESDMSVPVDDREFRVIDGQQIAREFHERGASRNSFLLPREESCFIGALLNSSGKQAGQFTASTVDRKETNVECPKALTILESNMGLLRMTATRSIEDCEELRWAYPWKHGLMDWDPIPPRFDDSRRQEQFGPPKRRRISPMAVSQTECAHK